MVERLAPLEPRVLLATFAVTNPNDSGAGSLRLALADADALAGTDTVPFDSTLSGTLALSSGLSLNSALGIVGPGAPFVTISGGGSVRPFNVTGTGASVSGLAVADGNALLGAGGAFNVAGGADFALTNLLIQGNNANGGGGLNIDSGGAAYVDSSTFLSNNDASTTGGGGAIRNSFGTLLLVNSTLTQNSSSYGGGAIYTVGASAATTILSSTITQNADLGSVGTSGGIYTLNFGGTITTYANTIVSGNTSTNNPSNPDVYGANTDVGRSFVGGSLNLGPIAWLGGGTPTIPLLPGSPAINAGLFGEPGADQRGVARILNPDSGAFETDHNYYAVTTTADAGAGSLRTAIASANAAALVGTNHVIYFGFSGTGVQTIQPTSGFTSIGRRVLIDGSSQIGSKPNTSTTSDDAQIAIYLAGNSAGASANGLYLVGDGNTVSGLAIGGFNGQLGVGGIRADSSHNGILGNFLGSTPTGVANPNDIGFLATSGTGNTVGGVAPANRNVLSGNARHGIEFFAAGSAGVVVGNFVGTTPAGTAARANGQQGVMISQPDVTVGGTKAGAGNVISGNASVGVYLQSATATGNVVVGNLIGTHASGLAAVANPYSGVALVAGAGGNTIGGSDAGAWNLISGNGNGVFRGDAETTTTAVVSGNVIAGNFIGTDRTGLAVLPNDRAVWLAGTAQGNTIGGPTATPGAAPGNALSGNRFDGIEVSGANTTANVILGNLIGLSADSNATLPNLLEGVAVYAGAHHNTIGGSTSQARNVISGNGRHGVLFSAFNGPGADFNVVAGYYVGVDPSGIAAMPNGEVGVYVLTASNTIASLTASAGSGLGNVISANASYGVIVTEATATGNLVAGNLIGLAAGGSAALGNDAGCVVVSEGARFDTIGGTTADMRNVISGNAGAGVAI